MVVAIQSPSAILRKDITHYSGTWDCETGNKTISGWSSRWNLSRCLLENEMHPTDNYYHTRYSSFSLSRYACAFDGLGNILARKTFQDRLIQPALGDDASTSWLRLINKPYSQVTWYSGKEMKALGRVIVPVIAATLFNPPVSERIPFKEVL